MYTKLNNYDFFDLLGLGDLSDDKKSQYTSQLVKVALKESLKTLSLSQGSSLQLVEQLNNNQIKAEEFQEKLVLTYPEINTLVQQTINKYKQQALLQQIQDLVKHIQNDNSQNLTNNEDIKTIETLIDIITTNTDKDISTYLDKYKEIKTKYKFVSTS